MWIRNKEGAQQRNEIQGTGLRRRRGGCWRGRAERIPAGITSVHVFMSTIYSSEAFGWRGGKIAYLLLIRIS